MACQTIRQHLLKTNIWSFRMINDSKLPVMTQQTDKSLIFRAIWSLTLLGPCNNGKCTVLLHTSDLLQKYLVIMYIHTNIHALFSNMFHFLTKGMLKVILFIPTHSFS